MNFAKLESNTERFQFLETLTLKCFREDGKQHGLFLEPRDA